MSLREILTKPTFEGLPIEFRLWEILYVVVLFLVLLVILDRFLFRPVLAVLAERDRRVQEGRGAERDSEREIEAREHRIAEKLAEARTESVQRLEKAKAEAEAVRREKVGQARTSAESRLGEEREKLESEKEAAHSKLQQEAQPLARAIASRLLGREVA